MIFRVATNPILDQKEVTLGRIQDCDGCQRLLLEFAHIEDVDIDTSKMRSKELFQLLFRGMNWHTPNEDIHLRGVPALSTRTGVRWSRRGEVGELAWKRDHCSVKQAAEPVNIT